MPTTLVLATLPPLWILRPSYGPFLYKLHSISRMIVLSSSGRGRGNTVFCKISSGRPSVTLQNVCGGESDMN